MALLFALQAALYTTLVANAGAFQVSSWRGGQASDGLDAGGDCRTSLCSALLAFPLVRPGPLLPLQLLRPVRAQLHLLAGGERGEAGL